MKNVVFIPNINLGNGRSDKYNYCIDSWKQWCDKNDCELLMCLIYWMLIILITAKYC